ncbi:hypothetical protein MTO96_024167 [Rhipicephalus appendiculatus]
MAAAGCAPSLLLLLLLLLLVPAGCQADGCDFPAAWWGEWFLQGAREPVRINRTHISTRGRCLEGRESKFLLSETGCVRCLGISAKHTNVLQYKETACSHQTSHAAVCAEFAGDASLYSLFRLNGSEQECPMQGPLLFSYNQGGGDCANPPSNLESCTEPSRLLLRFQACASVLGSESREEQLTCLASWKEGSVRYLVGRLVHAAAKTDADRLRCFAYEQADGGWQLAQSGDATCDALSGATEGSRTLRLWPPPTLTGRVCTWPDWFSQGAWQPLGEAGAPLEVVAPDVLLMGATRLRCLEPLPAPSEPAEARFKVQAMHQCASQRRCLGLLRRTPHVVELRLGDCDQPSRPLTWDCRDHQEQLQLMLGCGSDVHRFRCHGSWEENGTRLLVASAVSSQRHYCIAVLAQRVQFAESPPACIPGLPWPWLSFELTRTDSCDSQDTGVAAGLWPPLALVVLPLAVQRLS